uniref:Myotrophin n=1 Tax=Acrobeloides nanus TaxID=290746 RepID=A0A914CWQ8_9BILA
MTAAQANLDLVQWLVEHGKANVEATNNYGMKVLHYTDREDEWVEWDYDEFTDKYGMTVLHMVAARGNLDVVQWLVEHGKANVEATDNNGRTVLHIAAAQGNLDVVQWLVEHGADVIATDIDDKTPLNLAEERKKKQITEYLKKR